MDMCCMGDVQRVKELYLEDMDVVVELGIGWIEFNEFLKLYGFFFFLDLGDIFFLCC